MLWFSFVLKREVDEIECRIEGSLFHVRGTCIEKALSWGDERLMRLELKFIQWSLCVLGSVGLNNIWIYNRVSYGVLLNIEPFQATSITPYIFLI